MKPISRNFFHILFEYSILLKGLFAVFEMISGVLLRFLPFQTITRVFLFLTPDDADGMSGFVNRHLASWGQHLSIGSLHFAGWYLLSHGAIKLILIYGLWKKTLWMYPVSIFVFSLFVIYQMHRFTMTGAWGMVFLSVFDVFVIYLVGREYHTLKETHTGSLS